MIVTIYNYHKIETCFSAYTITLSVFKYKMITNLDIDIILVLWVATTATWAHACARGAGLSRTRKNTATCPI